jgi:uncharacterized protein
MKSKVRIGVIILLIFAVLGVPERAYVAPDRQDAAPPKPTGAQEAEVVAVMVDQLTQQPTIQLQGKRDRRLVSIAIGPAEMIAIAAPLQGVTPPRPLTHDLFLTLFGRFKVSLTRVVITDMRDDIFYAIVYLNAGGPEFQLDARPSDAIALAIRAKVPVLVEERVFEKAGNTTAPRRPSI